MANFHANFPWGKGMWIWRLSACEGGDISKIIARCKKYGISYVMVKAGDGDNSWAQFTTDLVKKFHEGGIKIYSWTYNYGVHPTIEADVALRALSLGSDGHIFDAEGEYERLPDPSGTAKTMLTKVRQHAPDAFLAHSPFPIISYHAKFPYREFGRFCDAVMPQAYWGTFKKTPEETVKWMNKEWVAFENDCIREGNEDCIKPIIPAGQAYDNAQISFTMKPEDIRDFLIRVGGYMSVNFWSYQHLIREDCWEAIRDTQIKAPDTQLGEPIEVTTDLPLPTPPPANVEVVKQHGGWYDDPADGKNKRWWVTDDGKKGKFLPVGFAELEDLERTYEHGGWYDNYRTGANQRWWIKDGKGSFLPIGMTEPEGVPQVGTTVPENTEVKKEEKKVEPVLPTKVEIPADGSKVTVTMRGDKDAPGGVETKITYHKTHLDYFLDFIGSIKKIFGGK